MFAFLKPLLLLRLGIFRIIEFPGNGNSRKIQSCIINQHYPIFERKCISSKQKEKYPKLSEIEEFLTDIL
mgnify:CR=1 FL=1